jgi:glycerol-3-phosphate acyltransferase PlsX
VDVIVTDGFTGNVALKSMAGAARFVTAELRTALTSSVFASLGAILARPALRRFRDRLSPPPAAPLLGLNGIVLKCHGGATERDFAQSIQVAVDLARSDFAGEIERNMRRLPDALAEPPAEAPALPAGAEEAARVGSNGAPEGARE